VIPAGETADMLFLIQKGKILIGEMAKDEDDNSEIF